ncbi:hypothetical protein PIB30_109656, partial [Stylosanthes scabra]|nr:hypothetical protein [Stylosanthes scabra]
ISYIRKMTSDCSKMTPSFSNNHSVGLLVVLVDIGGSSASEVGIDTQSSWAAETNTRRLMVDLNMPLEGSINHSNPEVNALT